LSHTARFANHPNLLNVLTCPTNIPATVKMKMQIIWQTEFFEIWAMDCPLESTTPENDEEELDRLQNIYAMPCPWAKNPICNITI
jgi:hypothetical protein